MRQVTFVDYTPGNWVYTGNASMYVVAQDGSSSYKMKKSSDNKTFTTMIPNNITSIYFQRTTSTLGQLGTQTRYNAWSYDETDNLSSSTTYYAIGRGVGDESYISDATKREQYSFDPANYGYWVNSSCTGVIEVIFNDNGTNGNFQDAASGYPNIYIWDSMYYNTTNGAANVLGTTWPGCHMDSTGTNNQFRFYIPADKNLQFIISGNGNDTYKTADLKISTIASDKGVTLNQNSNYKLIYNGSGGVQSLTKQ